MAAKRTAARQRQRRKPSPVKLVCKPWPFELDDDEPERKLCKWTCPGVGAPRQGGSVVMFRNRRDPQWYVILHPSARNKGKWQATTFDERGPVGDVVRTDCAEALKDAFWGNPRDWVLDRTANTFGGLGRRRRR